MNRNQSGMLKSEVFTSSTRGGASSQRGASVGQGQYLRNSAGQLLKNESTLTSDRHHCGLCDVCLKSQQEEMKQKNEQQRAAEKIAAISRLQERSTQLDGNTPSIYNNGSATTRKAITKSQEVPAYNFLSQNGSLSSARQDNGLQQRQRQDNCEHCCNCNCHLKSSNIAQYPGSQREFSGQLAMSQNLDDYTNRQGSATQPAHSVSLINPHGSSSLNKFKTPAVISEYMENFQATGQKFFTKRAPAITVAQASHLALSQQFHNDALSLEMERYGQMNKYAKVAGKEKTLYPVNDPLTIKHRYHPAVFKNYNEIPEEVKHSNRFYVSKNWDGKFHVYDIGENEARINPKGLEFEANESVPQTSRRF